VLDAPLFATRWRWNATVSLAVPRNRGGKKVPPQLQRMQADDLMASAFPDAAACLDNIPGDREIPDHPLVNQSIRDCLEDAMDIEGLSRILERIHRGEFTLVSKDTPEPSAFADDVVNARPYQYVDDAPLEERRTHAVQMRRPTTIEAGQHGSLDAAAIQRVIDQERPDPRDVDELHDALLGAGFLFDGEADAELFNQLAARSRATRIVVRRAASAEDPSPSAGGPAGLWVAAERLPEILAVHPDALLDPAVSAPPSRAAKTWTREEALTGVLRGRLALSGPITVDTLAASFAVAPADAETALLELEAEGVVLRGVFTPAAATTEWCDRVLLARIHRYTLNRLRAEIAPVTPAEFMRFLFEWQHVARSAALTGLDGLREVIAQLDGFELSARAWEKDILPARVHGYEPSLLDMLCLTGEVGWSRLSTGPTQVVGATPIALFLREHADAWLTLRQLNGVGGHLKRTVSQILEHLRTNGASFAHDLAAACDITLDEVHTALAELVALGLVSSDGVAGLRRIIGATSWTTGAHRAGADGRWFAVRQVGENNRAEDVEALAWTLLRRYGVVFRRVLTREASGVPWRELVGVYRRLEARGEIRGGRFVSGMSGEQFAVADAVERLRELRRSGPDDTLLTISGADPLNFTGVITPGDRIRAVAGSRIVYRNGVPIAAMEGDMLKRLAEDIEPDIAASAAALAAGRRVPVITGYVGRLG
jgi:ATP-dependent Lhr-like helicase